MDKRLTLKNHIREIYLFNRRIIFGILIIAFFITLMLVRLIYLQVYEHGDYTTLSQQNRLDLIPIEPNRGLIYDRNGVLMAENRPAYSLDLIPGRVKNIKATLAHLRKVIPISDRELKSFFKELRRRRRYEPVAIKPNLDEALVARFLVNQYRFPGMLLEARMVRHYPLGKSSVAVLGYVGRINDKELDKLDPSNYSATNYIGKLGVEHAYEALLHGNVGYQEVEIDAAGRVVRTLRRMPPQAGANIYLSIDAKLEIAAEKALGKNSGAVVAVDPRNGQVLALASTPNYDPNLFIKGLTHKEYEALKNAPDDPLFNRALRGQYPLASTIKPFIALDALMTREMEPDEAIFDKGWFKLKNSSHIYHDWKRDGHGWVNMTRAIVVSCDTYFYILANKLGINRIADILKRFGFGAKTKIKLPGELSGLVPTPEWKKRVKGHGWYPGDTVITGIGQGFTLTTPLQLAMATAMLAAHGQHYLPNVLYQSQVPGTEPIKNLPRHARNLVLPEWEWGVIADAMQKVVTSMHGTALRRFGRPKNYTVAAKTGTAQVVSLEVHAGRENDELPKHLRDHSLFIGFAPVHHPKIAIAVVAEHSEIAPTIARKVMDAYFNKSH